MSAPSRARAWWAVAGWAVFQLTLTSVPGSALPEPPPFRVDWVAHFTLYFGLGFLVARALPGASVGRLLAVWALVTAAAALDEWHQALVPGRESALSDWLMDLAGASAGLVIGGLLMRTGLARWLR